LFWGPRLGQQSKALELRTATSLSRLWQQQEKQEEAHQLLAEVYGWFTEGFDTVDLKEAKTLLEALELFCLLLLLVLQLANGWQRRSRPGLTSQAQKAMSKDATLQVVVKLTLHIRRQACGGGIGSERGEKGLKMFCDNFIELLCGSDPRVRRWQQQGP
jgi:hypothetical protein